MVDRPTRAEGTPETAALPRDVVRALEWSRAHLDEPVRLEALARIAGVPPRTLETHFMRFLGMTPLGWVRQARMAHARRTLLASEGQVTVSDVALRCGFSQLGRFAAQYAGRFGELPSETLRRIRRTRPDAFEDVDDESTRLAWRALPAAFAVAPGPCSQALEDMEQAQELAPSYGLPKALAAWCWSQRAAQHFGSTPQEDTARAVRLAGEACRLAPGDSLVLTLASGALTLAHRLDEADRILDAGAGARPRIALGLAPPRLGLGLFGRRGHRPATVRDHAPPHAVRARSPPRIHRHRLRALHCRPLRAGGAVGAGGRRGQPGLVLGGARRRGRRRA